MNKENMFTINLEIIINRHLFEKSIIPEDLFLKTNDILLNKLELERSKR